MNILSASKIDAAMACIGSVTLQAFDSKSEDAEWGITADRYVTRAREVGREIALGEVTDPDYRARCEAIDIEGIPKGAEPQVALAWNPISGATERLAPKYHRDYSSNARIFGTLDWAGIINDTTVFYEDVKSGNPRPAIDSWQLRFGAVALAGLPGVWAEGAQLGHLRLGWNGKFYPDRFTADAKEMSEWADQLRDLWQRKQQADAIIVAGGIPPLVDNPHCKYCGAQRGCPNRVALVRVAASGDLEALAKYKTVSSDELKAIFAEKFKMMSPENAGAAYERIELLVRIVVSAKEAAKDMARGCPMPLPDGRILREVDWPSTEIDAAAAGAVLERQHGHAVAAMALETSQAAIERALREVAPRGKLAAYKRAVMADLNAVGGVFKMTHKQVRVVTAEKK